MKITEKSTTPIATTQTSRILKLANIKIRSLTTTIKNTNTMQQTATTQTKRISKFDKLPTHSLAEKPKPLFQRDAIFIVYITKIIQKCFYLFHILGIASPTKCSTSSYNYSHVFSSPLRPTFSFLVLEHLFHFLNKITISTTPYHRVHFNFNILF